MTDCKNALVEADGDIEKAVEVILKKGLVKTATRAGKVATEGEVAHVGQRRRQEGRHRRGQHPDRLRRARRRLQDVREERHRRRREARQGRGSRCAAEVLPAPTRRIDVVRQDSSAASARTSSSAAGTALEAARPTGLVHAYVHMGGKIAVLVAAEAPSDAAKRANADFKAFAENVCDADRGDEPARRPQGRGRAGGDRRSRRRSSQAQLKEEGKPEATWPKIIDGKVAKWFTEVTLLGQDNVVGAGRRHDRQDPRASSARSSAAR